MGADFHDTPSTEPAGTWPGWLADRTAAALAAASDPAMPPSAAIGAAVAALRSLPGVTDAWAGPGNHHVDGWELCRAAGPAHELRLRGPAAHRADVAQAASMVAATLGGRFVQLVAWRGTSDEAAELAATTTFHHKVWRLSPFLTVVHDADNTLRWVSRPLGVPIEPPSSTDDVFAGRATAVSEDLRGMLADLRAGLVADGRDIDEADVSIVEPDGSERTGHLVLRNLTEDPDVRGVVSYIADTTSLTQTQYRLRVESARLRVLMHAMPVAVLVVNEQMSIAEVNPSALRLMDLDRAPADLVGCTIEDLMGTGSETTDEVLDITADFAERSIGGGVPVYGEEIHLPDGTILEADYVPITIDGVVRGHLMLGREVTGWAEAQHALQARNRELADLAVLKNEFLTTVSHELRTPLAAASSLLDLMPDADAPAPAELLAALRRNTDRLMAIVEDLLMLARIEANQQSMQMRPITADEALHAVLDVLVGASDDTTDRDPDRTVFHDADPELLRSTTLRGDLHWLRRMITYATSGSYPARSADRLRLHTSLDADRMVLDLSDDTLPTTEVARSSTRAAGHSRVGIGIGLALAKAIARRHGGDLRVEDSASSARVQISLPLC